MKKKREMVVLVDVSLITAVVQRGKADEIVAAAQEAGAQGASIHYAHGRGVRERLGILGLAIEAEEEVINIIVSNDQANRVFESIYKAGDSCGSPQSKRRLPLFLKKSWKNSLVKNAVFIQKAGRPPNHDTCHYPSAQTDYCYPAKRTRQGLGPPIGEGVGHQQC